jgi:hypothetical protein
VSKKAVYDATKVIEGIEEWYVFEGGNQVKLDGRYNAYELRAFATILEAPELPESLHRLGGT